MCWVSLCFEHFWMFSFHFVVCFSNSREPYNIFIYIHFCFLSPSFSKFKAIAVVVTETEHTVMSTLLYLYAYLFASWLIFIFEVVLMSITGCNIVHYCNSLLINTKRNTNSRIEILRYVNISVSAIAHIHIYVFLCLCICTCACIYIIPILTYLSIFLSTFKISSKEIKLLFDSSFMLTWCNWAPK